MSTCSPRWPGNAVVTRAWTGVFSSLGPKPATPAWPYCHTMRPAGVTMITRLSGQPLTGSEQPGSGGLAGGVPGPEISVRGSEALGVVRPDEVGGPGFAGAVPELPQDGVRVRVDLEDAVVELIRHEDV